MPTDTENFLKAEAAVTELLSKVQALSEAIERHGTASTALDEARKDLNGLIRQTAEVVTALQGAAEANRKVDTAEILSRLAAIGDQAQTTCEASEQAAGVARTLEGQISSLRTSSEKLEAALGARATTDQVKLATETLLRRLEEEAKARKETAATAHRQRRLILILASVGLVLSLAALLLARL